jgi:multimeric flavodoxin WrbA
MSEVKEKFDDLHALIINATLTRSPEKSHTDTLIQISQQIMQKQNVKTEVIRSIDYSVASGVYPDMRQHGWDYDDWPAIQTKIANADILVLAGPIWLGDNSSEMKKIIERLYGNSSELNDYGQYANYGKVGGCLITGNEDGLKHCAMNILYSLQHIGYSIPPQSDAGWIGEVGPGASYGDVEKLADGSEKNVGIDNDFTNRNTTFMTWNLMHFARMLKDNGGIPAHGNQRKLWDKGERFDFKNPEYR